MSELITADVPLVAALRQSELEPFGFPWRLLYLGDPLYRAGRRPRGDSSVSSAIQSNGGTSPWQTGTQWSWWSSGASHSNAAERDGETRIDPGQWAKEAAAHDLLAVAPIVAMGPKAKPSGGTSEEGYDSQKLQMCMDTAIAEASADKPIGKSTWGSGAGGPESTGEQVSDWRAILRQVRRERLDDSDKITYDELIIDALEQIGCIEELQAILARIPPEEAGPRVWEAHELCAFDRLARLPHDRTGATFDAALRIWDEAMGLSWPRGSRFPAQLTERVAAMTGVDPGRRLGVWQEQLQKTARRLESRREQYPHVRAIIAEQTRVEAQRARR